MIVAFYFLTRISKMTA